MRRKGNKWCVRCGKEPPLPSSGIGRRCRVADLKRLIENIESGKRLIRSVLSPINRRVWDTLTSQRKKLAVFQCWENGWLIFKIGSEKEKIVSLKPQN